MNRERFEAFLSERIGQVRLTERIPDVDFVYRVIVPKRPVYFNQQFSLYDDGFEGIRITFYNFTTRKYQLIEHIYHWADAYDLLAKGLENPGQLRYRADRPDTVSIAGSLGRQPYDFQWEVPRMADLDDDMLRCALQLMEYGYIDTLEPNTAGGTISPHGKFVPCNIPLETLLDNTQRAFLSGQRDPNDQGMRLNCWKFNAGYDVFSLCSEAEQKCKKNCCIVWLSAYLEYAAHNDTLYELLRARETERAAFLTPSGPYQFTWTQDRWLKTLDESRFNLALQMVDSGSVKVGTELDEYNRVNIFYPTPCFNLSTPVTSRYLAEQEGTPPGEKPLDNRTMRLIRATDTSQNGCQHCTMRAHCVRPYAGYIKYLRDCGREDEIAADRAWFQQHRREAEEELRKEDLFDFTLPTDAFLDEPEEMFAVAELLQERNYVSIRRKMEADENDKNLYWYAIETTSDVVRYDDIGRLKQDILKGGLSYQLHTYRMVDFRARSFGPLKKFIVVAGYVDYLRKTGQYEEYRERVAELRRKTVASLAEQQKKLKELENVLAIARSEKESTLYCVIQGERGIGKREIIGQIADLLKQGGKIDSRDYKSCTFSDLSSHLGYLVEGSGVSAYANFYYEYEAFEKRRLYVLTDLKEFLYAAREANESDGSKESHLIKLLGRYQRDTYIIVIGEEKYVEQFLELSPQIKFLFSSNVIHMDNLSPERLYEIFSEKVSSVLQNELEQDDEFRNRFLDYIIMNRKLLPLKNQELAEYLAEYANNRGALALPPDAYRKKSAKEMLASVIGMENVKQKAEEFERYAMFLKRAESNGMALPNSNLHMIFTGNPGTGKTMVARVIGQMLYDLGIVKEFKVKEVEAKDLKAGYIGQSAGKTANVISEAMGGVLFIDEAYSIGDDSFAKEVIATLIKAMEDHKNEFVVIFAGYVKEMQDFLNINPGIASRIGYTFHFDDYTAEELKDIFDVKMTAAGFTYDRAVILPQVKDICEFFSTKKNFGNGRFVDKLIQNVIMKHSRRDMPVEMLKEITQEDIPDVEELVSTDVIERPDYETQLSEIIGMETVKAKVRKFAKFVQFQQRAKIERGAKFPAGNMHMLFTGNPGTGKTTIARIMADVLYDIGILKENKLVEVERKDLVAEYVGQTAERTGGVIERALGGILFIDEAYTLAPENAGNDFGAEAIATIIKAMEDHKSDLIVIFAGYKDEMRRFVNANPGIASRIGNTFHFEDYTPDELLAMYRRQLECSNFTISAKALKRAKNVLDYFSKKKNFGNGRFVGKLVQETLVLHSDHILEDGSNLVDIREEDIPDIAAINNTAKEVAHSAALDQIIGMTAVKQKLKEFERVVNFGIVAKEQGLTLPSANMHMVFTGSPGTGKTTIARIIAQKLYDIGVIMENKLVEVERKDLIAGYVGQTAMKTGEQVEKAIGGILFVDEAYTLTPKSANDFGGEAIATLIKAMEDHKDDLIVIFAGYEDEMRDFIDSNPGIASRIGFTFRFEDYNAEELRQIFLKKMESSGFVVTEAAQGRLQRLMQYFCRVKNFGNGRFVDKVIQNVLGLHAKNYVPQTVNVIDESDIPEIRDMASTMDSQYGMVAPESVTAEEQRRVAVHESGHALVQWILFPTAPIQKITIRAEGTGTLGYVEHGSDFGLQNTKAVYKNSITVLMAGLAAEKVFLGDYADGGLSDIQAATTRANMMITQCGMSKYGFAGTSNTIEMTNEINEILKEGFDSAIQIIGMNREKIEKMVDRLLEGNDLTGGDIQAFFEK